MLKSCQPWYYSFCVGFCHKLGEKHLPWRVIPELAINGKSGKGLDSIKSRRSLVDKSHLKGTKCHQSFFKQKLLRNDFDYVLNTKKYLIQP